MLLPISISLLVGFSTWYVVYSIECWLNSGTLGRNQYLMAFQLAWQQFQWTFLPGGTRRRSAYFRDSITGYDGRPMNGCVCGNTKTWQYRDIFDYDLFDQCTRDIYPGIGHLFLIHICLPLTPLMAWTIFHLWRHGI